MVDTKSSSAETFVSVADTLRSEDSKIKKIDLEELSPQLKLCVRGGNYIHYNTKNKDFIKMHMILKAKGIKRNDFFIRVYDKGLIDIDPFDPNLSREMQKRVIKECQVNFFYFIRECVRFRAPGRSIPCQLNLGNLSFYYCKLMCLDTAIELPRQFGKTGGELLINIWASFFCLANTELGMCNKAEGNLSKDLSDMKAIIRELPAYLKVYDPENANTGTNNTREIFIKSKNVRIRTFVSGSSDASADAKGRGFSIPFTTMDEAPFIPHFKAFYLGFRPAMSRQVELAKANRVIYGCTLSTTSGTLLDPDQAFFKQKILDSAARFIPNVFNFDTRRKVLEYMARNASGVKEGEDVNVYMYIRYNYRELGKGEEYFAKMCSELQHDEDNINKDVLLRWVDYSKSSPYRRDHIERLDNYEKDPLYTIMLDEFYPLDFYTTVSDFDFTYVLSVDVSAGKGGEGDSSAIMIHDPRTLEVVALYKSNIIDIPQLTFLVREIATKIFTGCVVVIEVNGVGHGIVQSLAYDDAIAPRLYHEKMDTKKNTPKQHKDLRSTDFGFLSTTKGGKMQIMYRDIVADAIANDYTLLRDHTLIEQIGGLEKDVKTGKIKAAAGKHKDIVSAFVIGRYAILFSPTIHNWINPKHIRSVVLDSGTIIESAEKVQEKLNDTAKKSILKGLSGNNPQERTKVRNNLFAIRSETNDNKSRIDMRGYMKRTHRQHASSGIGHMLR
jgi:hypothetical protein